MFEIRNHNSDVVVAPWSYLLILSYASEMFLAMLLTSTWSWSKVYIRKTNANWMYFLYSKTKLSDIYEQQLLADIIHLAFTVTDMHWSQTNHSFNWHQTEKSCVCVCVCVSLRTTKVRKVCFIFSPRYSNTAMVFYCLFKTATVRINKPSVTWTLLDVIREQSGH